MLCFHLKKLLLIIKKGNILEEECQAIVCPANSFGYMRGGLSQAIRIAGGDSIEDEVKKRAPIAIGDAVVTSAGNLKAKFIIHSPTMSLPLGPTSKENVKKAVKAALNCALNHEISSLVLPAMGTGTGWLPYSDAAEVELREIISFDNDPGNTRKIVIVAHSEEFFNSLLKKASELGLKPETGTNNCI